LLHTTIYNSASLKRKPPSMQWQLNYSREANNYALDSYPYNEALLNAIQGMIAMPSPYPAGVTRADHAGILIWQIADHAVYYQVNEESLTITILAIHPL
jgi:hypothetical protein